MPEQFNIVDGSFAYHVCGHFFGINEQQGADNGVEVSVFAMVENELPGGFPDDEKAVELDKRLFSSGACKLSISCLFWLIIFFTDSTSTCRPF